MHIDNFGRNDFCTKQLVPFNVAPTTKMLFCPELLDTNYMSRRKLIGTLLGILLLTIGVLVFIHFSNDHAECETVVENSIATNGEIVTTEWHICNEWFNI
jgi:hypothetical protein